jgi:hypothetical protein
VEGGVQKHLWILMLACSLQSPAVSAQMIELDAAITSGCSEKPGELLEGSCGENFFFYPGRVSWDPLVAVGPISISVQSRLGFDASPMPLYVEIVTNLPDSTCQTVAGSPYVIMTSYGATECGGIWQTIGPIDLKRYVPIGGLYAIRLSFIEGWPTPFARSPAVSRIKVKLHSTPVTLTSWTILKRIYQ